MKVTFDPAKRAATLADRGLDFADAVRLFDGSELTVEDTRFDYPEPRFQTYGWLDDRLVMIAWLPDGEARRVISMRKCNDREQRRLAGAMGRRRSS